MAKNVNLGKLKLKNPIILASGTFDRNITNNIDVNELGAIVTKTITLKVRSNFPKNEEAYCLGSIGRAILTFIFLPFNSY